MGSILSSMLRHNWPSGMEQEQDRLMLSNDDPITVLCIIQIQPVFTEHTQLTTARELHGWIRDHSCFQRTNYKQEAHMQISTFYMEKDNCYKTNTFL